MFLLQQQKADERMQKTESLLQALISRDQTLESNVDFPQSTVLNTLNDFIYCPESNQTFAMYFRRYEYLYNIDYSNWLDQKKIHLLLSKLGAAEHDKFVDNILPQKTRDLTFTETVKLLTELFSPKTSLFHKQWKCLNLTKKDDEDYLTFSSVVNKHCDEFKLADLSADDFKCLIFVQGLVSTKDTEIRRRILNKLESEPNLTLKKLAEDCQRIISVKKDSRDIEESRVTHVRNLHKKNYSLLTEKKQQREDTIPLTNWKNKLTRPLRHLVFVVEIFIGRVITHFALKNA